jgi:hypothetical protein
MPHLAVAEHLPPSAQLANTGFGSSAFQPALGVPVPRVYLALLALDHYILLRHRLPGLLVLDHPSGGPGCQPLALRTVLQ